MFPLEAHRAAAAVAVALIVEAAAACSSQTATSCYPGDSVACTCAGSAQGFKKCGADGQYGACACSSGGTGGAASATASTSGAGATSASGTGGTTATTAGSGGGAASSAGSGGAPSSSSAGGAGGAGGLLPFMSPCTTNAQCETGLCWMFPTKGPHCDKMCTTDADCPPPSVGCNPQGVCRAP